MKKFLTITIFFLLVVLSSFSIYKYYLLKTENNTLNQKLGTIQKIQSDTSDDALDYYKKLSIRAVEILDEKQLVELAKKEWNYSLSINDRDFTGESINISGNKLVIKLNETREQRSALPEDIRLKGQIQGYFYKQINVDSKVLPEITNVDERFSTSVIYKFESLGTGDKIKITLSNQLKERLGLKYNNYSIDIH